ncbi:MAG: PD-(D/E)XK nuclease family protein [Desulfobacteraceae bacterium]|nr:PD-(D/E)XK nuclease family protein [Desulfobacteraceae bacterium]
MEYLAKLGHFFESYIGITEREKEDYLSKLNSFFEILHFKMETWKEIKIETDKKLSTDFSVFHFINTDELMLSRILALCLNPSGSHGQEKKFLIEFFNLLKLEINIHEKQENIRVVREYPTDKGRFIDIVIEIGDSCIIGIENKPYINELENQVGDYVAFLESKVTGKYFDKFYFIFLHKTGDRPISIDTKKRIRLEAEGKLFTLSYIRDMKNVIYKFYQICESDRFRYFLQDYINFISDTFKGVESGQI